MLATNPTRSRKPTALAVALFAAAVFAALLIGSGAGRADSVDADAPPPQPPPPSFGPLVIHRVDQLPEGDDPFHPAWDEVGDVIVPLLPQNMASPSLDVPVVAESRVRALTDGRLISWRIQWADASADQSVDTGRFADAAAIQFPLTPNAPFTMGFLGMKVQILHWKAVWQKDIDERFQDVQDLHPNYWSDLYWFATPIEEGNEPFPRYRVPDSFRSPLALPWFTARAAGNPVADPERTQPVEELIAQGFGTLTHQEQSDSTGRGVWHDGHWTVVFTRPLRTDDPSDYQFAPESQPVFSIAIWEGASGNVGGRKQWAAWTPFEPLP